MPRIWKKRIELDKYHRDDNGYIRGDRPFTKLLYHLNISPKYRVNISDYPEVMKALTGIIEGVCRYNNWPLIALAIQGDHVHIFIQLPPSVSISDVVRIIKANSSRQIREQFPFLRDMIHKSTFWSRKYSAFTVGGEKGEGRDEEKVKKYIEKQGLSWVVPLSVGRKPQRS